MKLKRRIILSAVSVFCAAAVTVASLPYNAALAAVAATTTDYLNLRTGAGTDKKVILSLSKGVSLTVLDNSDNTWAKVKTASGLIGYCHKQYLSISGASSAAPASDAKVASGASAVTTSNLNLRSGAGSTNAIIVTMSKGTSVKVIDSTNASWYKVQTSDGKFGYCTSQFLQIAASSASQTAVQTGNSATQTGNSAVSASSATAVATDYVNLRQGAGSSYKVLETVSKGASLKVLDSSNAQWTKVQTPSGKQGYCSKQYLSFSNTSASPSSNTASPTAGGSTASGTKVLTGTATSSINLRSGAGSTFSVIATLPKGTVVTVTDNSNNVWAKVKTSDGKQGYCSKSFLKIVSSVQQSTPSTTTPTTPAAAKTLIGTTTSGLNLRSGAGTSFSVVVCLAKGATVTVTDNSNATWAKVKTADGKTGYCQKKYLKITEKTAPQTNTNTGTGTNTNTNTNTGVDTNNGSTDTGTNSGSTTHTITGASVTADLLRLREQPNSSANVVTNLPKGTTLTVLEATDSTWTKVQTSSGQVGYVCTQYIKIHYSDDSDSVTDSTGLLSASSCSIPMGKMLYIKASGSASVTWTSSDPSVATVSNGYVYAAAKGSAVITATNGTDTATCNITVTDAEPVKTAYASPNIASTGAEVTFTAVTDTARDAVQFVITMQDGTTKTLDAGNYTEETMLNTVTRKWTASTTFDTAGTYSFTALSSQNSVMSSSGFKTDAYISNQQNFTTTSDEERRASDQMIALIAKWEGYRAAVYADQLTSNQVPTIGYGCTFGANAVFYNDMTETEAWSLLINKINNGSYTTELNKMIKANHFQMSQNQADCLISFAYNVGAGYFNSTAEMDFRRIMKNAVIPPDFSAGSVQGTVTKDAYVYDTASRSGNQLSSIPSGTAVTVTKSEFADTRDGWYGVTLADGSEGWINSGYINLANSDSLIHNLNYTNAYAFGTDLIRWNQAGGKFYTGLFYRRMGEVNVYNYGDYDAARSNKYGYSYPNAAAGLD